MDGLTLALDASAGSGTIAVLRDAVVIAQRAVEMRSEEEERFLPAVIATLADAGVALADCARIVCGAGPGSFTSLRVVGASAKGLAQGAGLPLFAVPSLALIVGASADTMRADSRWLVVLDALRGERYVALVRVGEGGSVVAYESLGLLGAADVAARAAGLGATAIGPQEALRALPHAAGLARCAGLVSGAEPVPLATWEPVYGRLAEAQVKWEAAHGRPLR